MSTYQAEQADNVLVDLKVQSFTLVLSLSRDSVIAELTAQALREYEGFQLKQKPQKVLYCRDNKGRILSQSLPLSKVDLSACLELVLSEYSDTDSVTNTQDLSTLYRRWQLYTLQQLREYLQSLSYRDVIQSPSSSCRALLEELSQSTTEEVQLAVLSCYSLLLHRFTDKAVIMDAADQICQLYLRSSHYQTALQCLLTFGQLSPLQLRLFTSKECRGSEYIEKMALSEVSDHLLRFTKHSSKQRRTDAEADHNHLKDGKDHKDNNAETETEEQQKQRQQQELFAAFTSLSVLLEDEALTKALQTQRDHFLVAEKERKKREEKQHRNEQKGKEKSEDIEKEMIEEMEREQEEEEEGADENHDRSQQQNTNKKTLQVSRLLSLLSSSEEVVRDYGLEKLSSYLESAQDHDHADRMMILVQQQTYRLVSPAVLSRQRYTSTSSQPQSRSQLVFHSGQETGELAYCLLRLVKQSLRRSAASEKREGDGERAGDTDTANEKTSKKSKEKDKEKRGSRDRERPKQSSAAVVPSSSLSLSTAARLLQQTTLFSAPAASSHHYHGSSSQSLTLVTRCLSLLHRLLSLQAVPMSVAADTELEQSPTTTSPADGAKGTGPGHQRQRRGRRRRGQRDLLTGRTHHSDHSPHLSLRLCLTEYRRQCIEMHRLLFTLSHLQELDVHSPLYAYLSELSAYLFALLLLHSHDYSQEHSHMNIPIGYGWRQSALTLEYDTLLSYLTLSSPYASTCINLHHNHTGHPNTNTATYTTFSSRRLSYRCYLALSYLHHLSHSASSPQLLLDLLSRSHCALLSSLWTLLLSYGPSHNHSHSAHSNRLSRRLAGDLVAQATGSSVFCCEYLWQHHLLSVSSSTAHDHRDLDREYTGLQRVLDLLTHCYTVRPRPSEDDDNEDNDYDYGFQQRDRWLSSSSARDEEETMMRRQRDRRDQRDQRRSRRTRTRGQLTRRPAGGHDREEEEEDVSDDYEQHSVLSNDSYSGSEVEQDDEDEVIDYDRDRDYHAPALLSIKVDYKLVRILLRLLVNLLVNSPSSVALFTAPHRQRLLGYLQTLTVGEQSMEREEASREADQQVQQQSGASFAHHHGQHSKSQERRRSVPLLKIIRRDAILYAYYETLLTALTVTSDGRQERHDTNHMQKKEQQQDSQSQAHAVDTAIEVSDMDDDDDDEEEEEDGVHTPAQALVTK